MNNNNVDFLKVFGTTDIGFDREMLPFGDKNFLIRGSDLVFRGEVGASIISDINLPIEIIKGIYLLWKFGFFDLNFVPCGDVVFINIKSWKDKAKVGEISLGQYEKMLFLLKIQCKFNVLKKKADSNSLKVQINGKKYGIRVSLHPFEAGEILTLRIINNVFFDIVDVEKIRGLVLIGGSTCSGKTTYLYSIITSFLKKNLNVITLEDPVEYEIYGAIQTDVKEIGYFEGIKSVLRHTPDVICIGEIRDNDSARAAVYASLTGHNVVSTIHAGRESDVFNRFPEIRPEFISDFRLMKGFRCV